MWFIGYIVGRLNDASSYFYSLYLDCYYSIYIPTTVANWFYSLSTLFSSIAWDFYYFGQWVDTTANALLQILSWSTIQSYITNWLYYLYDLSTVFYYFWTNVTNVIGNWWASTSFTVQSWIDTASAWLQSQVDNLNTLLINLRAEWDAFKVNIPNLNTVLSWFADWWGYILANLSSWWDDRLIDITGLIDSAFLSREPFWAGWQDWRDSVIEFIQDPWGWLYDRVEDLFDRFW